MNPETPCGNTFSSGGILRHPTASWQPLHSHYTLAFKPSNAIKLQDLNVFPIALQKFVLIIWRWHHRFVNVTLSTTFAKPLAESRTVGAICKRSPWQSVQFAKDVRPSVCEICNLSRNVIHVTRPLVTDRHKVEGSFLSTIGDRLWEVASRWSSLPWLGRLP